MKMKYQLRKSINTSIFALYPDFGNILFLYFWILTVDNGKLEPHVFTTLIAEL